MAFRSLLAACAAGVLVSGNAGAGAPDPDLSTVRNVVYSPGALMAYAVTVMSVDGPVSGAIVRLHFTNESNPLAGWCSGQEHPDIDAVTNASGVATFNLGGGGCLNPANMTNPPVQVYANGVLLREVGVVSVDAVDDAGRLPTQGWNPSPNVKVGVGDAVFHTPPLKTGAYSFCTDFNSDGACDLTDAVLLTPAVKVGWTCTYAP